MAGVGEDCEIASLLMMGGLPRDENGHPYQVLVRITPSDKSMDLVTNADGRVLAWANASDGDPIPDLARLRVVPGEVEDRARQQLDHLRRGHS